MCAFAAVAAAAVAPSPATAAAPTTLQGTAAKCSGASDGLTGIAADARPVVLVHGWRGSALRDARTALEAEMGREGWQFFLFDYERASAQWAADEDVAGCLADYLQRVSQAHDERGGDYRIHVVAHSMGGLAVRFAVEDHPDLASSIAGVVTIATPHTGSPWGNSGLSTAVVDAVNRWTLDALPEGSSRASVCLAVHQAGQGLPAGCAAPLYLPPNVPITQIEGAATISRTFFGFHAYDIILAGDSIVPSQSAAGYLGSAPGSTTGMKVRIRTVSCRTDARALLAEAGTRTRNPIIGLSAALAQLHIDGTAMDAVMAGTASPALGELVGIANLVMPCSHVQLTTSPVAITAVAEALRADAAAAQEASSLTLGVGGALGELELFAAEDDAVAYVKALLGEPSTDVPDGCDSGPPLAGRTLTWGPLRLLIRDDTTEYSELGPVPGPALVGWEYSAAPGADRLRLRTEEGTGLGSSLQDVRAAYPDGELAQYQGSTWFDVFRGDFSNIAFLIEDDVVVAMTSGARCPE